MRARPPLLALAAALAACAAPQPNAEPAAVAPAPSLSVAAPAAADVPIAAAPAPSPLELGLAAIDARSIAADVAFLADDALEGRGSPSAGLRLAALYFQSRVARLGLEPGTRQGWLHRFPMDSKRVDPQLTRLAWERSGSALVYGESFGIHPQDARSGRWSAPVVYGGDGRSGELTAEQAAGKWILFANQRYGRGRRVQRTAAELGALGTVLVGGAENEEPPFAGWREQSARIHPTWPSERSESARPCVWLTPAAAALPADLALGTTLEGELALEISGGGSIELENVAALWRGRGPRSGEIVVVSAHYDHLGRDAQGAIHNGADDNASGSAALLALAEALVAHGPLERSVLLLWVSAEELGLYGSRAWCDAPDLPEGLVPYANVNLDMVGRNAPERIELCPSPEHERSNPLSLAALELVGVEGFAAPVFVDQDFERSDQASFADGLGLPVVYLSAGEHPDYHEPSDDAERIDSDKIARITRLVLRLLSETQDAPLVP
jgi:hypothetical protein